MYDPEAPWVYEVADQLTPIYEQTNTKNNTGRQDDIMPIKERMTFPEFQHAMKAFIMENYKQHGKPISAHAIYDTIRSHGMWVRVDYELLVILLDHLGNAITKVT